MTTLWRAPFVSLKATTSRRWVTSDSQHRKDLFWHQTSWLPQDKRALSFLPEIPHRPESVTVIGTVANDCLSPSNFDESRDWLRAVHTILGAKFQDSMVLQTMAKNRQNGFLHIVDERNPPELNRVADPDDIIAMVLVQDGKLVTQSYEPMPSYRVCTQDGLMTLNAELHGFLVEGLKIARDIESEADED